MAGAYRGPHVWTPGRGWHAQEVMPGLAEAPRAPRRKRSQAEEMYDACRALAPDFAVRAQPTASLRTGWQPHELPCPSAAPAVAIGYSMTVASSRLTEAMVCSPGQEEHALRLVLARAHQMAQLVRLRATGRGWRA